MEYYTEEQVDQMLSNAINQTMTFAENGGIMNEEQAWQLMKRAFVHPSTGLLTKEEIQKQIEAVRGMIGAHNMLLENLKNQMITFENKDSMNNNTIAMNDFSDSIRTLTAMLKPHLEEGQQLDV